MEANATFRTILDPVVLYPCDAVSAERLVEAMAQHTGIAYLRTRRGATPVIYDNQEQFPIGGCKVLRQSGGDRATVPDDRVGIGPRQARKLQSLLNGVLEDVRGLT